MLNALFKAFEQLLDPKLWRVLGLSFVTSLIILGAMIYGVWGLIDSTNIFPDVMHELLFDWFGKGLSLFVAWLLFPAVAGIVTSLWLEPIIKLVEAEHYPNNPKPRDQTIREIVWETVKLTLVIVGLNIVVMPLYIPLWFVGLGIVLYYALNGYLIGREYFDMVAMRRLEPKAMQALRYKYRKKISLAGIVIAFGFTVPFLNLLMPVVGAAFMVHVFEDVYHEDKTLAPDKQPTMIAS